MNQTTFHNLKVTKLRDTNGYTVVEVDTSTAHYFGINWKSLGSYGKRKFETLIMLSNAPQRVKILYV